MKNSSLKQLILNPKYWSTWFFLGLLSLVIMLPLRWLEVIGSTFGMLLYYVKPSRVRIAAINLKIAYPDKNDNEIQALCKENFKQLGIGVLEIGLAWWQLKRLIKSSKINGLEHLTAALKKGNGVILLTSHFTCLEVGGHILSTKIPLEAVFKPARNKAFNYIMFKKRQEHLSQIISNGNPRKMITALKRNHVLWYAPDQNLRGKDIVFAPYFNKMATTITAASRLAKLSGASLIPYYIKRHKHEETGKIIYEIFIQPKVENFPTDDLNHDAAKINSINETLVRNNPAQYLWVHQRYKTRPEGEKPVY